MTASHDPSSNLEAYADGVLDASQRSEFEARLEADPSLRQSLEVHNRVSESIRRVYSAPGALVSLPTELSTPLQPLRIAAVSSAVMHPWTIRSAVIGLAAAIALLFAGYQVREFFFTGHNDANDQRAESHSRDFRSAYEGIVQAGFEPATAFENMDQLETSFRANMRQTLKMKPIPADVLIVGFDYVRCATPNTIAMLASAEKQKVMIFGQAASAPAAPDIPESSGLKQFKRIIGKVALYEVTPNDHPRLLDLFYEPTTESQ